MAILRPKEIQQLSEKEFDSKLFDLRKELMKLNSQRASGTNPENPGRIRAIKRTIARMLTVKRRTAPKKGGEQKA